MRLSLRFQSLWIVVLSLFLSLGTLQAAKQKEEGFFFPDDLKIKPELLANAYQASTNFPMGFSNCSGAFISPDGYYLTAYHCLIGALGITKQYTAEFPEGAQVTIVPSEVVLGTKYRYPWGNFSATVVAVGLGYGQFDERTIQTVDPASLKLIQDAIGTDWAILKVDNVAKHECLEPASHRPKQDDYSWIIGYPARTKRNVGERTDNHTKLISFGKVAYSVNETEFYKTLPEPNKSMVGKFWNELIQRGEYFITDSDGQGGNSGSPVINRHGKLTGVLVQGLMPAREMSYNKYHRYSTAAIDLTWIKESLGEKVFHTYFTCKN